jgi:GDP-L-fucose synthase
MEKNAKIFVTGHRGLVGSALVRALLQVGYTHLILRTRTELDLLDQRATERFFLDERPDYVFLAAAKTGGIYAALTQPAPFLYENSTIQNNVIHSAYKSGVKKLLFMGSSCVYPKHCPQPIKEEYLMTGPLEITNDAFAIGKIEGIYTCQAYNRQYGTNFISVMPCNFYGPNDNFDPTLSHVLPSLMHKFHVAARTSVQEIELWGSGTPRREFLHVDDVADGCIFAMNHYDDSCILNIGSGTDVTILELADLMRDIARFRGKIIWDPAKPDGTPRKVLDVSRLHALGWRHQIELRAGIEMTYAWYRENRA